MEDEEEKWLTNVYFNVFKKLQCLVFSGLKIKDKKITAPLCVLLIYEIHVQKWFQGKNLILRVVWPMFSSCCRHWAYFLIQCALDIKICSGKKHFPLILN